MSDTIEATTSQPGMGRPVLGVTVLASTNGPGHRFSRGQSEPIAALVAVAVVCAAVSIYAGVFTTTLPTIETERDVSEAAADNIWQDVSDDGVYVHPTNLHGTIDESSLPAGYYVAVAMTYVGPDGTLENVGSVVFDGSGHAVDKPTPEDTLIVQRAVAIRLRPGDVRPGQYTVEVWK